MDRAKQGIDSFKQMKSGDILGGIASTTNTVTGVVQGLSGNITKKDGSKATLNDIKADDFKVNNNFYADVGVNLGFNKTSSNSKSHNESAVVTTIKGKDENSSITYNNVNNIEYVGTQAQDTKFIYNNVENINKTAVELTNSYSSSSRSSGISTGVTIGYGDGTQTSADAVKVSASQSKMNSNGTTYQNGRFVDVDEVHNNTKNMILSGFNQEGGTVTGNIENLKIESKQNTSVTKGSSYSGSVGVSPSGTVSGDLSLSKTNGERRYVDTPSSFIVGEIAISKITNTFRRNLNTSTNINNYKEFPNNSSPINSNTVSLNQEFTTINGLGNNQFSNQAEVVKTVNVKNPLQDVSNIVDWKPVKKVDSSGEYLMNVLKDNKTNYYLDYKIAGYYASDIRNMTLTEMRNVGTRGWNKTVRMLKGDAKDAYNFYRARAVEIMGSRNIEKKFPDGSLVEQVLNEGFDKNGYKINFRNFSAEGEGNYPTIDLYNTNGKSKYEIKFEE